MWYILAFNLMYKEMYSDGVHIHSKAIQHQSICLDRLHFCVFTLPIFFLIFRSLSSIVRISILFSPCFLLVCFLPPLPSYLFLLVQLIPNSFSPVYGCHCLIQWAGIYCTTWRKRRFTAIVLNEIMLSFVWMEGKDSINMFWLLRVCLALLLNFTTVKI